MLDNWLPVPSRDQITPQSQPLTSNRGRTAGAKPLTLDEKAIKE